MSMISAGEWLRAATARLKEADVPDAARDARLLLRWAQGSDGLDLQAADPIPATASVRAAAALERRLQRVPMSHITGRRDFWHHSFRVTADVLDPRPDTETLIAVALDGPPPRDIVDIGTGSGCIVLSLVAAWPSARGVGIDVSPAALAVARANAAALALSARVAWIEGSWLEPVEGRVDLIVSNPPYLTTDELAAAQPELRHEPRLALDGGDDGLTAYREIAAQALRHLRPAGRLIVEIGAGQGEPVSALLALNGFLDVVVHADLNGLPRVVAAKAPESTQ